MAVQNATVVKSPLFTNGDVEVITWNTLANGDTGAALPSANRDEITAQITGTFGASGSVSIEGSNDGTTWFVLNAQITTGYAAATATANALAQILEAPLYIRPHVTAGDGTTAITVVLVMRHATPLHQ